VELNLEELNKMCLEKKKFVGWVLVVEGTETEGTVGLEGMVESVVDKVEQVEAVVAGDTVGDFEDTAGWEDMVGSVVGKVDLVVDIADFEDKKKQAQVGLVELLAEPVQNEQPMELVKEVQTA